MMVTDRNAEMPVSVVPALDFIGYYYDALFFCFCDSLF